jgi:phage head maturation protease/uncharacterized protein YukE
VSFQVKAVDDQRYIIEGILNAIWNIDDGDDRTMPNAFKKTLNDSYSRKSAQHLDYLYPYLWNHSVDEPPIGGIFDGDEVKAQGDMPAGLFIKVQLIPDIERARNVYSCFKSQSEGNTGSSGLLRQSMGYKAIRYEYVNEKVDGQLKQVRNLLEVQLWEGSSCVFPMNTLAIVTNVKSNDDRSDKRYFIMPDALEIKTVCGDTSLPIGPRDESWDGSAAKKQIFAYASDTEGNIDATKAKKCFLQVDGDPSLKGSYGYPFCVIEDGSPRINVGGVVACAGALSGSRGSDTSSPDVDGMRAKVATMYKRISEKYKDDPELTPPWKDDGKRGNRRMDKKDFNTLFMAAQAADALEDWSDLVDTLTQAMMQAFCIGDEPASDMQDALAQFGEATMKWVDAAMACSMDDYLSDRFGYSNDAPYMPYSMRMGGYDRMSRHDKPEGKAGARFSQATTSALQDHVKDLQDMQEQHKALTKQIDNQSDQLAAQYKSLGKMADQHKDMVAKSKAHDTALQQKADDLSNLYKQEGQGPAYANDNDENQPDDPAKSKSVEQSRREPLPQALTHEEQPPQSTDPLLDELADLALSLH